MDGGSAQESNLPKTAELPRTDFEDRGWHQPTTRFHLLLSRDGRRSATHILAQKKFSRWISPPAGTWWMRIPETLSKNEGKSILPGRVRPLGRRLDGSSGLTIRPHGQSFG